MRYFDLRLPLGWLFVVLGLLLAIAGLATPPPADTRSLAININLCWGGVMVAFGLLCLWLARREARRRKKKLKNMHRRMSLIFTGLLWLAPKVLATPESSPVTSQPMRVEAQNTSSDAAELTKLLKEFLAGASHNDLAAHERFWADELIYTSSNGRRLGKADILKEVREEGPPKPGEEETLFTAEDIRIHQYDSTAIVAFRLVGTTTKKEKVEVANYLNTGTFLKRNGEWRAVAWQATVLPAEKPK